MTVAVTFAVMLDGGPAVAQEMQVTRRAVLVDIEEEVRPQGNDARGGGQFELNTETLDQWVFNGPAEMARQNYQSMIKLEIEQIDAACGLSAEQKQMLELAGAGELQQIREALAMLHAQYAGRTYDQDKVGEIFQKIQPLQAEVQRHPLSPTSLPYKLLPTTLDASQTQRLADWKAERQRVRLLGQIHAAVAAIEQQVPLRGDQRQALIQLLQAEVRPLIEQVEGQNRGINPNSVLAQMNAMAPEPFQAFLDDAQWEALQVVFVAHRSHLRLLQQRGLLPPVDQAEPARK